jgi:hypothetical protein
MQWPVCRRPQLSIIVPFRDGGEGRRPTFDWLQRFYRAQLPRAEMIVCDAPGWPFSKAAAVDLGVIGSRGHVLAILDADCWLDPRVIQACADNLLEADREHRRTWYVPYLRMYRLNEHTTEEVIHSDPFRRWWFPDPPKPTQVDHWGQEGYGHQYGALALIMPRLAFFESGMMDPRFRGWGGEDGAFMRALDTLWGPHEVTDNEALHLWHERPGTNFLTRRWEKQSAYNVNGRLAQRYNQASNDPTMMRALIEEESR